MESTNLIPSDYFEICLISKKIPFVQAFRRNIERVAFSSSFDQRSLCFRVRWDFKRFYREVLQFKPERFPTLDATQLEPLARRKSPN